MKKIILVLVFMLAILGLVGNAFSTTMFDNSQFSSGNSSGNILTQFLSPAFTDVVGAPEPITVLILTFGMWLTSLYRRRNVGKS